MIGVRTDIGRDAALSTLAWLVDAGVDALVDDAPAAWLAAPAPAAVRVAVAAPAAAAVGGGEVWAARADSLAALAAAAGDWDGCGLGKAGAPLVFGAGASDARVMLVGDVPDGADALLGGNAGRLLDRMLAAIGLARDTVWLTNALFWPTPAGRAPAPGEIAACAPFVQRQLALLRPAAVLAFGGVAMAALTGGGAGINRLRGKWQEAGGVPLLATFHPRALLATPAHKALAWADLQAFEKRLNA